MSAQGYYQGGQAPAYPQQRYVLAHSFLFCFSNLQANRHIVMVLLAASINKALPCSTALHNSSKCITGLPRDNISKPRHQSKRRIEDVWPPAWQRCVVVSYARRAASAALTAVNAPKTAADLAVGIGNKYGNSGNVYTSLMIGQAWVWKKIYIQFSKYCSGLLSSNNVVLSFMFFSCFGGYLQM